MKNSARYAVLGAVFSVLSSGVAFAADDSVKLAASVKDSVSAKPGDVLAIVEKSVSANPGLACEVVKAAIEGSHASPETVASIVQTASTAAPDQMRLIAQCSLAAAPDAIANVQAVLARLDPGTGGGSYSAKEAGSYLYGKNVRIGKAVPTNSPDHYKVVDPKGAWMGDIKSGSAAADARVRATTSHGGITWIYFPHAGLPGNVQWKHAGGGILTIHSGEDGNFYLQFSDDDFNPLDLPKGEDSGIHDTVPPSPGGGLLPPGPGTNPPPVVLPPVVTPTGNNNNPAPV